MYASLTRFPGDLVADFDGLQRQIEQILGQKGVPSSIRAANRGAFPAINMGATEHCVEIYAFAPGVDPASIEVSVDRGLLTIAGERRSELPRESEKVSVYASERFAGPFKRVVSLPDEVDTAGVAATCRNGVLRLAIPKRESSRPRRIDIKE